MPNSWKKSDGDAFSGVQFGDAVKAQGACGMTDCDQVCDVIGLGDQKKTAEQPVVHLDDLDCNQQQATAAATAQWVG